ncbi:MAG: FAD-dependent oxidoreductase [Spirochaetales bacterium]|nr:FAD-dependent oxidoreductase [Spirochaetales bacterium]
MKRYVIVGGVAGGAGVAARLRRLDEQAEITMYERGEHISFANCGLPYYAGGVITERSRLFVMTPSKFKESLNVVAKTLHEVVSIDREAKTVRVKNLTDDTYFEQSYDTLILSPGATPIRPPIPGIEDSAILSLRSVSDIDRIKAKIDEAHTKRAVVVGGGFIGIEMAENLKERGLEVTVVEAMDQVMNIIDYDMAAIVQGHLREKGVTLRLKNGVSSFTRRGSFIDVTLADGQVIETDLVILSIGVKPDTAIAREAGLDLASNGAIKVDPYFNTSDPSIRAVGDAIEFQSPLLGSMITIPLAGPANKQARLCAYNAVHGDSRPWKGTIATSIARVFDITVASTGVTEKTLKRANLPYRQAVTHAGSHAGYYPGSFPLALKILYHPDTGALWGAQAVGPDGVDKRIDVISAILGKEGTVHDLAEFDHAYAPPYSSAKDPVNMVGFIAENVLDKVSSTITWEELPSFQDKGAFLIDVRSNEEAALGSIPGATVIPQTELRQRLTEIPRDKPIVVFCAVGLRGYLAERVLRQHAFTNVVNLTGGYKTWLAAETERAILEGRTPEPKPLFDKPIVSTEDDGRPIVNEHSSSFTVDACGLQCPGPIMRLKQEIEKISNGDILTVTATDPGFARDAQSWCTLTGNRLVSIDSTAGRITAVIEKNSTGATQKPSASVGNGSTLIVFSNDLDKALASFVLANGAAASGKQVTMFFTFWGLSVIRKNQKVKAKKDLMGTLFGMMLPRGMKQLNLSSMNFGGAGARMMKGRMKSRGVDQVETMFEQAQKSGVRMIACQMSMDIMGISETELLEGVEIGGVATYMEAASNSTVNLFV